MAELGIIAGLIIIIATDMLKLTGTGRHGNCERADGLHSYMQDV